jgi:hypothetical protein
MSPARFFHLSLNEETHKLRESDRRRGLRFKNALNARNRQAEESLAQVILASEGDVAA